MSEATPARREQLGQGLRATADRVRTAAAAHGREEEEIALIVVTKYFPVEDIVALVQHGVRSIGESRDQEARAKIESLRATLDPEVMPQVHMIGQVQTKKARSVVRYADVVHSLDREKLAARLDHATQLAIEQGERDSALDVLIQVDLGSGQDRGRGGVSPEGCAALADDVARRRGLCLRGVMAIAPDPEHTDPRSAFSRLAATHREVLADHPGAVWMSAGMSGDLEEAIAAGATHLRVGSAILGSRHTGR